MPNHSDHLKCSASPALNVTGRSKSGRRARRSLSLSWPRPPIHHAPLGRTLFTFERAIIKAILVPRHGWPAVPRERHVCTMALALAHGYPGSLDGAATMLGLASQKDVAAAKEVAKMWRPRKPKRGEDPNVLHWIDTPELRMKLYAYCKRDVATTRALHRRLSAVTESEQEVWMIDAEINDRGVLIDAPLAQGRLAPRRQGVRASWMPIFARRRATSWLRLQSCRRSRPG